MEIVGVAGLPEIRPGDDLAALITAAGDIVDGDVVVVTSKIVSKAEGRIVELDDVTPSGFATDWATKWDKDPRVVELVLQESKRIVRMVGPVLITETHHGFVCANSGIDQSSSGAHGRVVLLPEDCDASAGRLRERFGALGADVGIIVSDTAIAGAITCTGCPPTVAKVVRNVSCRCMIASMLRWSSAESSGPSRRKATGML